MALRTVPNVVLKLTTLHSLLSLSFSWVTEHPDTMQSENQDIPYSRTVTPFLSSSSAYLRSAVRVPKFSLRPLASPSDLPPGVAIRCHFPPHRCVHTVSWYTEATHLKLLSGRGWSGDKLCYGQYTEPSRVAALQVT